MMRGTAGSVLVLGLVIAGCSGYGNTKSSSQEPARESPRESAEQAAAPALVLGTVAYRERMALPADAEAYVWIIDTTPGIITTQAVIGEVTVQSGGKQVPLPFTLPYDPSRIAADHDYGIKAVIKGGGKPMFETKEATAVITKGKPIRVDLMLTRVAE